MTGRVFTKLLFSFLLVLSIGTSILDFSVRRIVAHSLTRQASEYHRSLAERMARQLAAVAPSELPAAVAGQALAARADITVLAPDGAVVAQGAGKRNPSAEAETIELTAGSNRVGFVFSLEGVQATLGLLRRSSDRFASGAVSRDRDGCLHGRPRGAPA